VAARYAVAARVAVRNVRRDGMEELKRMEKDGELALDDHHKAADSVQEVTDGEVKKINDLLAAKESEIMTV
jgi:ribosome recycling factor